MGIRRAGPFATVIRRVTALAALVAQAALLIAPLGDVHDAAAVGPGAITAASVSSTSAVGAQHGHSRAHDPSTCPACIAQWLHANFERPVGVPAVSVAQSSLVDPRAAGRPQRGPPVTHHSRAPPLAV